MAFPISHNWHKPKETPTIRRYVSWVITALDLWFDPIGKAATPVAEVLAQPYVFRNTTGLFEGVFFFLSRLSSHTCYTKVDCGITSIPLAAMYPNQNHDPWTFPIGFTAAFCCARTHAFSTPPLLAHETWPTTPLLWGMIRFTKKARCFNSTSTALGVSADLICTPSIFCKWGQISIDSIDFIGIWTGLMSHTYNILQYRALLLLFEINQT